jgi:hypothetical protein
LAGEKRKNSWGGSSKHEQSKFILSPQFFRGPKIEGGIDDLKYGQQEGLSSLLTIVGESLWIYK